MSKTSKRAERRRNHGFSNTRIYHIWENMKSRCLNPNDQAFSYYGGRGITVCDAWSESFEAFRRDMGEPPSDKHSIDRIDNDGNYEPGNCRWATQREQMNNIRTNRRLTINGVTRTVSEWARAAGVPHRLIFQRLSRGWPLDQILTGRPNGIPNHNSSGMRGVHWHKRSGKWMASISINGRGKYLGIFTTAEDASDAYEAECKRLGRHNRMGG